MRGNGIQHQAQVRSIREKYECTASRLVNQALKHPDQSSKQNVTSQACFAGSNQLGAQRKAELT